MERMGMFMTRLKNPVLPGTSKDLIDVGEENSSIPTQWHSTKLEQCVFDVWSMDFSVLRRYLNFQNRPTLFA